MALILRLLLPLILISSSLAQVTFIRVDKAVVDQRLKRVPSTDMDRLHMLRAEFVRSGCPKVREQLVPGETLPNVLCTIAGSDPSAGTILISAPLNFKNQGDEAAVGWAGLLTLPLLTESINSTTHRYTFVLAAFSGNRGIAGSKEYWKELQTLSPPTLRAAVALSEIGRSPAKFALPWAEKRKDLETIHGRAVLSHPVTERDKSPLTRMLEVAADALKFPEAPQEYDDIPNTEATVFSAEKIPAVAIHSMAYTTIPRVGGTEIKLQRTAIDSKAYYDTYTMLSVYSLLLDRALAPTASKNEIFKAEVKSPDAQTSDKASAAGVVGQPQSALSAQAAAAPTPPPITEEAAITAVPGAEPVVNANPSGAAGSAASAAPAANSQSNAVTVFRSSVQLVQVDVVVTGKNGEPINDLKATDFTVLQDGVPREIRAFEAHSASMASSKPAEMQLPDRTYTNLPNTGNDEARTILLFDMLNTPASDQQYAQKQLVKVLREMPEGRRISIFALSQRLTLVQGFTADRAQLLAAAEALSGERSYLYAGVRQTQKDMGALGGIRKNTDPTPTMPTQAGGQTIDPSAIRAPRETVMREEQSFLTSARVEFTLDALDALARAVSGYPGRKSVLWISGGFPVSISADPNLETATRGAENYRDQLARTSKLLATSRIAMYPIDVRGIQPRGIDISLSNAEAESMLDMRQPVNSRVGTGGTLESNSGLGNVLSEQSRVYGHERSTMLNIAHDTGGRAFIGSNNIRDAIARGIEDGARYYTIAYTPDAGTSTLAYHKIEVKVAKPDVNLTYRRGYYSLPQQPASADVGSAALRGSLQPGMPPATSLFLTAKISPPEAPGKPVRIDYIINPNGVTFTDASKDTKHTIVDCMVVAFDQQGREAGHASDTLDASIPMNQYDWVLRRGLPANQELVLKPGAYNLRLGVMDRATQQIGTLDVPLVVPAS